jgi:cytochrome c biogenesis protein
MSAIKTPEATEHRPQAEGLGGAAVAAVAPQRARRAAPTWSIGRVIDGFLGLLSAVPFGVSLLVLLITACMIGMLIQQVELETFPKYFAQLTPAEKSIYGNLGFFDIYHVWYFNLLLLLLSLNIILASIDHFPKAWNFVRRKKLSASPTFAMTQRFRQEVDVPGIDRKSISIRAVEAAKIQKFKTRVTEEESRTTIFAERGTWNRLGAYAVHVGLLTIFLGGFLTSRGHTGGMWVEPGKTSQRMTKQVFNLEGTSDFAIGQQELELPFSIEGLDIEQKLIDKKKGIDAGNTLDWLTSVRIRDHETNQVTPALIHMNKPFDYRGYRFFQASVTQIGSARQITIRATPAAGGTSTDVTIKRDGYAQLPDGTRVLYVEFNPDFAIDANRQIGIGAGANTYDEPAAHLEVVPPGGAKGAQAWAFTEASMKRMEGAPFMQSNFLEASGYRFTLLDFEKVAQSHMLSIQYDPGVKVVYVGFLLLCLTLIGVFFFSHQRLWIVVEEGKAYLGGDANRNRLAFEDRAKKVAALIAGS